MKYDEKKFVIPGTTLAPADQPERGSGEEQSKLAELVSRSKYICTQYKEHMIKRNNLKS